MIIDDPPKGFEDIFDTIFSDDFKIFLVEIVRKFDRKIDEIFVGATCNAVCPTDGMWYEAVVERFLTE